MYFPAGSTKINSFVDFGLEIKLIGKTELNLKEETVNEVTFFIVLDKNIVKEHSKKIVVGLYENGEKIGTVKTKFLGPFI